MEWGATLPPPSSPPRTTPSLHRDVAPLLTGSTVGECRSKHLRAEGGPRTGPSRQLPPALAILERERGEDSFRCTDREEMGPTSLLDVQ
jgi:hypothetical protein